MNEPKRHSWWVSNACAPIGAGAEVRVMGVVEGWVVARRKGAAPFLTTLAAWWKEFTPSVARKTK